MRRSLVLPLILSLPFLTLLNSCTIAKFSGRGPMPLLFNQPNAKVQVIKNIKVSKMIVFDYTASHDVAEIIFEEFEQLDADAIINITIALKYTPIDFLVNLFTFGLANAHTLEIQGQAVYLDQLGELPGEVLQEAENYSQLDPALLSRPNISVFKIQDESGKTVFQVRQLK